MARAALGLACGLVLLVPTHWRPDQRLTAYLLDGLHFPLFAVLAWLLLAWRPSAGWRFTAAALAALVALGGLIEIVQPWVGRTTSLRDWTLGSIGALAAALAFRARRAGGRPAQYSLGLVALGLTVAVAAPAVIYAADGWRARRDFPLLASFESRRELGRWRVRGVTAARSLEHATHGRQSLVITSGAAPYAGLFLAEAPRDWSRFRHLHLDAYVPGAHPVAVWIRLDDRRNAPYDDRAQVLLNLAPGPQQVTVSRDQLDPTPGGRPIRWDRVRTCGLFFHRPGAGQQLYLDHWRLAP